MTADLNLRLFFRLVKLPFRNNAVFQYFPIGFHLVWFFQTNPVDYPFLYQESTAL